MVIYGVALFYILLEQVQGREFKLIAVTTLSILVWLPLLVSIISSRRSPVAFPPYYPPAIQQCAGWIEPGELVMTDVPWAFAWYGNRQSVWLTLNAAPETAEGRIRETFYEMNDFRKPVSALFLTPKTTDANLYSDTIRPGDSSWGTFAAKAYRGQVPAEFPLFRTPPPEYGYLSEHLFLTDRPRW
jgi:hypothetical protein